MTEKSSLNKLFNTEENKSIKHIINIETLQQKYNDNNEIKKFYTTTNFKQDIIDYLKTSTYKDITDKDKKGEEGEEGKKPSDDDFNLDNFMSNRQKLNEDNLKYINTYTTLMKNTQLPMDMILKYVALTLDLKSDSDDNKTIFTKIYFLLNNIEILFLFDTFDYKLITRILNRNNFIKDEHYKKACFIAMVVFEMWSLVKTNGTDASDSEITFYKRLENSTDADAINNYKDIKRYKRITDLISEIKDDAKAYVNSPDFIYDLNNNKIEIEIPKRNLDNIIKPIDEIQQTDNDRVFKFNLNSIDENYTYNESILPNGIKGGVKRIKGGDETKLRMLQDTYDTEFKDENGNNKFNQTRFLFNCLITANEKGATKCLDTLSVSTAKIESYKIVDTLPRATLVKLAAILGIQFPNGKVETYDDWIKGIKNDFSQEQKFLDANGEVKILGVKYNNKNEIDDKEGVKFESTNIVGKQSEYRKTVLIHYIGQVIIDKLGDRNVEYDLLRAQNKAKVQFTKISGPEVSYRTKSNYTNFRSNPRSLSLSGNPIFMNMNLYSQQSPEQIDKIKNGIMTGGTPDAQLYSSNIYEKAITQALNKYRSLGFKIDPKDMNIIDDTINKLKDIEVRILDTYYRLMNVLQFSTMKNNPSFMANLSEEDKKKINTAWNERDADKIVKLKNELDKELKEKQVLADNAKTILDVIFPWKKSLDSLVEKVESIDKKLSKQS